jgi:uncharacterized protein
MARSTLPPEWRWATPPGSAQPPAVALRQPWLWGLVTILLIFAVLLDIAGYVQKWLWMRQLGYTEIFWKLLSVQVEMCVVSFAGVYLFIWINIRHAALRRSLVPRHVSEEEFVGPWRVGGDTRRGQQNLVKWLGMIIIGVSAAVALGFALGFSNKWDTYLRFRYGGTYGIRDPLFGVDVGFYLFRLPFYDTIDRGLLVVAFIVLAAVLAIYTFSGAVQIGGQRWLTGRVGVLRHLSLLLFTLAALGAWGFYLARYNLVYSTLGVVYGAGYAADHVTRFALLFMQWASLAVCAMLLVNVFNPQMKAVVTAVAAYVGLCIVGVLVAPVAFQHYVVQPNEFALETPYLKNYIAFTRKAYGLGTVTENSYPALPDLTPTVIARNQDTIENIRLWDARPLLQTYRQSQAIRLYYDFYGVDTDRYHLADGYHQVMLSTRELSPALPAGARTWVNKRLQFTHGYGIVMNFVSKTAPGGGPQYVLENIPAQSSYHLSITQPSIYFGKSMRGYRIVDTRIKEFDYPKGSNDVYRSYAGKGGILLDSWWKRALFAWTQGDINILLTSYVKPQSRIQIWRRVRERVRQIAPFLRLDGDPYPVTSDGKLYWIQDAYTTSDYFPYSKPVQTAREPALPIQPGQMRRSYGNGSVIAAGFTAPLNYIRNSVKVVVNMYSGAVRFYVMDPDDPVLAVYRRAFPGVFLPVDRLSNDLRKHLRYPEDMFAIQATQYRLFHMTDPQVFYNQEDLWQFPQETYGGATHSMRPYYVLMKLPGSSKLEYLLMTPFTPQNRSNMISWMAAGCDPSDYGKIVVFDLPKDKLIYGPNQIEALIDQNTSISRQITLWDQRGSRVIRGKQIIMPIENSFLYVVPLYLTSTEIAFPELKRVIVAADGRVAMAPTLDTAIGDLFTPQRSQPAAQQASEAEKAPTLTQSTLAQARASLDMATNSLQHGNWEKFGKAMDSLEQQLAPKTN